METCTTCRERCVIMTDNVCADCYWDEDSRRKHVRRSNPEWLMNRVYSFAFVVLNKSSVESMAIAKLAVAKRFPTQTPDKLD